MGIFSRKKTNKEAESEPGRNNIKVEKQAKSAEPVKQTMKDLYSSPVAPKTIAVKAGEKKTTAKFNLAYRIVIKPLVTEKVSDLGAHNKYVFQVAAKANKISVAKAISVIYGVKPIKVNIINLSGKKAGYGRIKGRRKDWKKAIITLPAGQTIKVYEGV